MFLVFALILLVVAVGILVSTYSVFFPFMQNLGTVQNYHSAYYHALSSVERAELGLRYKTPGFVGSGGFIGSTGFGPLSDFSPDFFDTSTQGLWRTIDSRTPTIPRQGMGNTDGMFRASDSSNFNILGYEDLESFLLQYDATIDPEAYYTGSTQFAYFSGSEITGVFRLLPALNSLGLLCTDFSQDCDPDGDGIVDDVAVSWSLAGFSNGNGFTLYPTIAVFYYSGMQIDILKDTAIRESFVNATGTLSFGSTFSPLAGSLLDTHTIVGVDVETLQHQPFSSLFTTATGLRLSFGATNLFRTLNGSIYPYLEYQFSFPQEIADRFYTIQGNGRAGEYEVQILLKKPTLQGTVGGDFTVIF